MRAYLQTFGALLARDIRVLRRNFGQFLIRTIMQPLLFVFVFAYVFPKIGQGFHGAAPGVSFSTVLVPGLIAVAINFNKTFSGAAAKLKQSPPLRFVVFGAVAYWLAGALTILSAFPFFSQIAHFTFFSPARTQLFLYGFFAMTMFGAIYCVVPLLIQNEWPSAKLIRLHGALAALGVAIYVGASAIGGILQGLALNDAQVPFADALNRALMFLRLGTLGDLLMAAGNVCLALNLHKVMRAWGLYFFAMI